MGVVLGIAFAAIVLFTLFEMIAFVWMGEDD